jgi:hypothetical protein
LLKFQRESQEAVALFDGHRYLRQDDIIADAPDIGLFQSMVPSDEKRFRFNMFSMSLIDKSMSFAFSLFTTNCCYLIPGFTVRCCAALVCLCQYCR